MVSVPCAVRPRSEYGPLRKCELCGVEVYQYAGPRVARPIYFESETGLQHSPRCAGVTDWVDAQLRELALPAWEQPGYHKPAPLVTPVPTRVPQLRIDLPQLRGVIAL